MAHDPPRTALSGPVLIRLLARLADVDVRESRQLLSDRLSQWLNWTDAITLSSALSTHPPAFVSSGRPVVADAEAMCARQRTALTKAIASTCAPETRPGGKARQPIQSAPAPLTVDYADYRQRYVLMQQTMELEIGTLRDRLRRLLAAATPDLARLAVLDASMEQALAPRERALLSTIPAWLGKHFERLRATEPPAESLSPAKSRAWLEAFRKDMQSVLLAELDVRFQPVDGLLAALRPS
ncbi:DUF3348 domain-containing protein [Ralstonia soli]|uniref:DUF3348 domain-containing protein n=1 Tax=Ralstonia soli TaxID=2953896 RepID=A0ABT1ALZ7_9RALS|nr:DUF3348 domain-containing protein [Ralstonia soli]MCO5399420.1 DUF3348 domain-containing protein [Ralstonia soli]